MGILTVLATIYMAVMVCAPGFPHQWRLSLFLPAFVAAMGFLQAKEHT